MANGFDRLAATIEDASAPTAGGNAFSRLAASIVETPPAPPEPSFSQKLGAGAKELFTNPGNFFSEAENVRQDFRQGLLGPELSKRVEAGGRELLTNPLGFAGEVPGALRDEGVDTAKELAYSAPRALGQIAGAGASTTYRTIGAVADVLGFDALPYLEAAKRSSGVTQGVDDFFGPTESARNNPYGLAGITRAVGPSIAQSATAFANPTLALSLIGTTVLGSSADEFDSVLKQSHPELSPDARNEISLALAAGNTAAQVAMERINPFQKLARGLGPAASTKLIKKLAWAYSVGAGTEGAQQAIQEGIKVGINPADEQVRNGLGEVAKAMFYGGFGEGTAPLVGAAVGRREPLESPLPPPSPVSGVVPTASDLRAVEALQEPAAPDSLRRYSPKDQAGQPMEFADDLAKAKWLVETRNMRGANRPAIEEYIKQTEDFRAGNQAPSTVPPLDVPVPAQAGPAQTVPVSPEPVVSPVATVPVLPEAQPEGAAVVQRGPPEPGAVQTPNLIEPDKGPPLPPPPDRAARRADAVAYARQFVDDGATVDLPPLTKQQADLSKAQSSKGFDIVWFDAPAASGGYVLPGMANTVFLNRNHTTPATIRSVYLHEFGHQLRFHYPELWSAIEAEMTPEQRAFGRGQAAARSEISGGNRQGAAKAQYDLEESMVIPLERLATDSALIDRLEGRTPGVVRRVVETFRKFVDNMLGRKPDRLTKAVRDLLDKLEATPLEPPWMSPAPLGSPGDPRQGMTVEPTIPKTDYGYWYSPEKGWKAVSFQDHENTARDAGFSSVEDAIVKGNVRVVSLPSSPTIEIEVAHSKAASLEGVKPLVREALKEGRGIDLTVYGDDPIRIRRGTPRRVGAIAFDQATRGEWDAARKTADGATVDPRQFVTAPEPTVKNRVAEKLKELVVGDIRKTVKTRVRRAREALTGEVAARQRAARDIIYDFSNQVEKEFGRAHDKLTPNEQAGLFAALKGAPVPYASYGPAMRASIDRMRTQLDEGTGSLVKFHAEVVKTLQQERADIDTQITQAKALLLNTPKTDPDYTVRRDSVKSLEGSRSAITNRIGEVQGLSRTLKDNLGSYANRSYRLFERPKAQIRAVMEGKGSYAQVRADFADMTRTALRSAGIDSPTKAQVDAAMEQTLLSIAGNKVTGKRLIVDVGVGRPVGILKRRQDLPPELRAAMGENIATASVFGITAAKHAALIAANQYHTRVRDMGLGEWLSKTPTLDLDTQLFPFDTNSPLHRLYATPDVAKLITEYTAVPADTTDVLMKVLRKANAVARLSSTAYSTAAAGANYLGQFTFLISNGIFSPVKWASTFVPSKAQTYAVLDDFPSARKVLDAWLNRGTPSAETRAEIQELTKRGVLDDNVYTREALESARELGLDVDTLLEQGLSKKMTKALKAAAVPARVLKALYNLSDTKSRIIIYFDNKTQLKRINPAWSEGQLQDEAADRAKNTYPDYGRAWEWAKAISRGGFIGTFATFSAEMIRTTRNNLVYGLADMADGVQKGVTTPEGRAQIAWGLRRYLGTTALLTALPAIAAALSAMSGVDDEKDKNLRESGPWWARWLTGFWVKSPASKGGYTFINLSRYAPILMFADIGRATVEGGPVEGAKTAAAPFVSEQIITARIIDVKRNRTSVGRPVYNEEETDENVVGRAIARHVLEPVVPDIIRRPLTRIGPAVEGKTDAAGRKLDVEDELLRMVGVTAITVDVADTLGRQVGKHQNRLREAGRIFSQSLRVLGTANEDDVYDAYKRSEDARLAIWQETYRRIESARSSGMTEPEISRTLLTGHPSGQEMEGLGRVDVQALMSGRYLPYNFMASDNYGSARTKFKDKVPQGKLIDLRNRRLKLRLTGEAK